MIYIKVTWNYNPSEEPKFIYSELDIHNNEIRKIHIFENGKIERADENNFTENTELSYEKLPSVDYINNLGEFTAEYISKEEFDRMWLQ